MTELVPLARPYAKAVFYLAKETSSLDQWSEFLCALAEVCNDDEIAPCLANISIDKSSKAECFIGALSGKCSQEQLQFIKVLAHNGRLILLPTIETMFQEHVNEQKRSEEVMLYSAYPLKESQLSEIKEKIMKKLNKVISLKTCDDPSVIGGVRIQGKGWIIDASIEGQLKALARNLIV